MQLSSAPHDHKMPSIMDGVMSRIQLDKHMDATEAKKIWDEFDKDASGSIDAKEARNFIGKFCEVQGIEASEVQGITDGFMTAFDVDKNGSLSFAELTGTTAMKFTAKACVPDEGKRNNYKTYADHKALGKDFPALDTLTWCTEDSGFTAKPKAGRPMVFLAWGKYAKPCYRYMPKYSALHACFRHHVDFVGMSMDPDASYVEAWQKKYLKVWPCTFALAFDEKAAVKTKLESLSEGNVSCPTLFLVDSKGKIVWYQDHSQIGATAPDWMDQVERQLGLLLQGEELETNGPDPEKEEEDEESEDEGGDEEVDLGLF